MSPRFGLRGASVDGPGLAPFAAPIPAEILDSLIEVVSDSVNVGRFSGAAHGDVAEFSAAAVGIEASGVEGGPLASMNRCGVSVGDLVRAAYFFVPPPGSERTQLADTGRPLVDLYAAVLGQDWQLGPLDERLAEIGLKNPEEADQALVAIFGAKGATGGWHDHFRTWRKRRLRQVERQYGDRLDEVADFLADFAAQVKAAGPKSYLQSMAHRKGEPILTSGDPDQ